MECDHSFVRMYASEGHFTFIYGVAGSGKTNLALWATYHYALRGYRTIYLSTEGDLFLERLARMAGGEERVLESVMVHLVLDVLHQTDTICELPFLLKEGGFKLLVVDSLNGLFREVSPEERVRLLAFQAAYLRALARVYDLAVVATGQVRQVEESELEASGFRYIIPWTSRTARVEVAEGGLRVLVFEKPFKVRVPFTIDDRGLRTARSLVPMRGG